MDQQQAIQFFIEVLQATEESDGNPEVVYPLLDAHQHILDEHFAPLIRHWATSLLSEASADEREIIARMIGNFGIQIYQYPRGSRANNIEIAIVC